MKYTAEKGLLNEYKPNKIGWKQMHISVNLKSVSELLGHPVYKTQLSQHDIYPNWGEEIPFMSS